MILEREGGEEIRKMKGMNGNRFMITLNFYRITYIEKCRFDMGQLFIVHLF